MNETETMRPVRAPKTRCQISLRAVSLLLLFFPIIVPVATSSAATTLPAFVSTTSPVTTTMVRFTWHAGCPVGPNSLRLLHLSYVDFSGDTHVGSIIVNSAVVASVTKVFSLLYNDRFPLRSLQPEDTFDGSDPKSMAADNSSGFNCRYAVAPGAPTWSVHAYGEAIDINPVENPYIEGSVVMPARGKLFVNRALVRAGMAEPKGVLVEAFASVGWQWGGRWTGSPDYQHFSLNGK